MATTITNAGGLQSASFDVSLVNLYDCQHLYQLARNRSPESRAALTDAVASLFNISLESYEAELAADVLLSLLAQAESDLRAALAERLAANERVPLRIALSLANDEINVAQTVLKHSPVLNDLDLMYIVQSHSAEHWTAVAGRRGLSAPLINVLADKRDESTAEALLKNDGVTLPETAMEIFTDMARDSERLRLPLVHRPELPGELAQRVYEAVGVELRATLVAKFPDAPFAKALDSAMEEVQQDIVNVTMPSPRPKAVIIPTGAREAARFHASRSQVTPGKMIEALRLGQFSYFLALFAEYSGLQSCMVDTLMKQKGGKGLAIACKARKMDRSDFMTVYMLKSSLSSRDKIVDHSDLAAALATFDRVQSEFAQKMLGKALSAQDALGFN